VIATGTLGDHGATILGSRHDLDLGELTSDCAPLGALLEAAHQSGAELHVAHDPTRGGAATTCCEVADRAGVRIVLEEQALPLRPQVAATCELLGLEPLYLACEGRALLWTPERDAQRLLEALRAHPQGRDAAVIGRVTARSNGQGGVALRNAFGGERPLDLLSGMDLPRIC
jgi:hydrogenase expression/formation protein HypE